MLDAAGNLLKYYKSCKITQITALQSSCMTKYRGWLSYCKPFIILIIQ